MTETDQPGVWVLPQELYDELMALPPGTDVTELFEFEPAWNLRITTMPSQEGENR